MSFPNVFLFDILNIVKGWGVAYDAIGVLSMLASMNGSGSGDPELRRVCRKRGGVFLGIYCPVSWLIIHIFIYV